MSLSLKLELKSDNKVLVTNLETNEIKEVTLSFIQEAAGNSLVMLAQYKQYELFIGAEEVWRRVQRFNIQTEKIREIWTEHKFSQIMNSDGLKISDYERKMYSKAIGWADSSNLKPNKGFDRFVFIPVAGGATAGALTYSTIGGIGVAASGTAFGVGALGFTAIGTIGGLAIYGLGKAIS